MQKNNYKEEPFINPSYQNAIVCSMMMDGPNRYAWQKPELVLNKLITSIDMSLVDLGAGTGFFMSLFSRALPGGEVISLEPETTLIEWLEKRKRDESLVNVSIRKIDHENPALDSLDKEIDILFVGYTYFHFENPVSYFREREFILTFREKRVLLSPILNLSLVG